MYYFDPSFGYVYIHTDKGDVRYGCGAVVPHNPNTVTEQQYKRFEGWVPIEQHYIPDEWLLAFKNPYECQEDKIVITEIRWGWLEWSILVPIWSAIGYVGITFLSHFTTTLDTETRNQWLSECGNYRIDYLNTFPHLQDVGCSLAAASIFVGG